MTRDETVALFLECEAKRRNTHKAALAQGKSDNDAEIIAHEAAKAHWNAWAANLVAERKALKTEERWAVERQPWGSLDPQNPETQAWVDKAAANFFRCCFLLQKKERTIEAAGRGKIDDPEAKLPIKLIELGGKGVRLDGFVFPGRADFRGVVFSSNADFRSTAFSGDADFRNARFSGIAFLGSATFSGAADFRDTIFSGGSYFGSTAFFYDANFQNAKFFNDGDFRSAAFSGTADFRSAHISGDAFFGCATFCCDTLFQRTIFSGNTDFQSTTFKSSTGFGEAIFKAKANFAGIKVKRAFDMMGATFARVPTFSQGDFKQAPDLDDVEFPLPCFWGKGNPKLIPLYRALRRIAIQAADHEREQMAFKGEVRCKRRNEHKPWHLAFWFGLAYDALSDFGRSIARPLVIGGISWVAFAAIYLWNAGMCNLEWGAACAGDGALKALKALTLSTANSLPLIGSSRSDIAKDFYTGCLKLSHTPAWSPILQIGQTVWSAVLIFLFLLALRNQFKIK